MRDLSTLIIMFCAIGFASVGYANSQDPYSETLVSTLASRSAPIASMQEKAVNRLGDGAAVGLIRHIGAQTPATPHEIEGILFVVRMAFAAPEIISAGADREPKATLLLLSYLNYLPVNFNRVQQGFESGSGPGGSTRSTISEVLYRWS